MASDQTSTATTEWHARAVIDRLGDLIDALNDDLQHEVSHSTAVREAVVAAVEALDDDRYTPYLNDWWLGGDRG